MNIHTDLEETTFGREDGDVAIVAASTSSAHFFLFFGISFLGVSNAEIWCREERAFSPRHQMQSALWLPRANSRKKKTEWLVQNTLSFLLLFCWFFLPSHNASFRAGYAKKVRLLYRIGFGPNREKKDRVWGFSIIIFLGKIRLEPRGLMPVSNQTLNFKLLQNSVYGAFGRKGSII